MGKNFHQIDREVTATVTSEEADRVTPLMSKIYLRLVNAPERFWEREGVLRIEAEERGERLLKAWVVLCDLVGVSSATASKALRWLHGQGIIGYFSGKNGVGLRIFINRAASSIGVRQAGKKILAFPPASSDEARASRNEAAFSDSFAVLEVLDTGINSRAPKNGAGNVRGVAMLEIQGQSIEVTLSEMSLEAGGFLLPEDAGRVREKANSLLSAAGGGGAGK